MFPTDDDLFRTGLMIKRLQMRHHNAANATLAKLGLTIVQWDALRWIEANPEASLHDLAQLTFQSDQAFGTLAARMQRGGLIERVAGRGRVIRLTLTARGSQLLAEGTELIREVLVASMAPLNQEQQKLLSGLLSAVIER